MTGPTSPSLINRLADQPFARVIAYYLVLAAGLLILYRFAPDLPGVFNAGRFEELLSGGRNALVQDQAAHPMGAREAAVEAIIAMVGAYLLMLPVAWIYIMTRQTRGYQQSMVQTLIVLPIVVSGVVVLVKSSIALAFSLGGIVGAISFRNRLDDTKDTVTVFLAIGVGVAAGVQVMSVALALSVFYNIITMLLWWTDFGRAPAALEGRPATRRLAALRASQMRQSGAFVSQVDSLLLKSMTPEQLDVLADRAHKRKRRLAHEIGLAMTGEMRRPRFDATLRMVVGTLADVDAVKQLVEPVLTSQAKGFLLEAVTAAGAGRQTILYKVRFKKSVPSPLLVEAVRRAAAAKASSVELA